MVSESIYGLSDMLFTEFVILDQNIIAANFNSINLRQLTQHLSVSIKTFYSSANHFHSEVVRTAEPHLKQVCISRWTTFTTGSSEQGYKTHLVSKTLLII